MKIIHPYLISYLNLSTRRKQIYLVKENKCRHSIVSSASFNYHEFILLKSLLQNSGEKCITLKLKCIKLGKKERKIEKLLQFNRNYRLKNTLPLQQNLIKFLRKSLYNRLANQAFEKMRSIYQPDQIAFKLNYIQCYRDLVLKKELGKDSINQIVSYLYSVFCKQRYPISDSTMILDSRHMSSVTTHSVVLPAFFNRKVVICPPLPQDAQKIMTELYMTDIDNPFPSQGLNKIILNNGFLKLDNDVIHRLTVLVDFVSKKIIGALHFTIMPQSSICRIKSLKIMPVAQGKKLGSLLLAYALQTAKENKCEKVSLKSSEEAVDFYLKYGFRAESEEIECLDDWEDMCLEDRQIVIDDNENELILEFCEPKVDELIEQMLDESMSFSEPLEYKSK